MLYRERSPAEDLKPFVLSFWEFAMLDDAPSPVSHEIFPDGCVSLFYIRNLKRNIHFAGLSGLYIASVTKPVSAGDTIWGARFSPAACSLFLRSPAKMMAGRSTFDEYEFPHLLTGLADKLKKCVDFDEAVNILTERVRVVKKDRTVDEVVFQAVQIIDTSRGEIHVDELAEQLGLSTRQFQRRFKAASGLSPKTYIRARRVRATAVDLVEGGSRSWANRAAEFGFSDQSHMNKEFLSITKRSPNSFSKKIREIEHGDLVK